MFQIHLKILIRNQCISPRCCCSALMTPCNSLKKLSRLILSFEDLYSYRNVDLQTAVSTFWNQRIRDLLVETVMSYTASRFSVTGLFTITSLKSFSIHQLRHLATVRLSRSWSLSKIHHCGCNRPAKATKHNVQRSSCIEQSERENSHILPTLQVVPVIT